MAKTSLCGLSQASVPFPILLFVCVSPPVFYTQGWSFLPTLEFLCISPFLFSLQVVFYFACTLFSTAVMRNRSIHFLFWWLGPSDIICHLTSTSPTSAVISVSEGEKSFPSSLLPIFYIKCEEPLITLAHLWQVIIDKTTFEGTKAQNTFLHFYVDRPLFLFFSYLLFY